MQLKHVLLICLVLIGANTFAQISFEASVSKTKLGVNERLSVEFTMNKDGDNFNPPEFTGFRKVGGPYQSVSQSWINGKSTYKKSYKYFLEPTATGNFTIQQFGAGYGNTTSAVDAYKFNFDTGTIYAGTIKLYGLKDS